MIEGMIKADNNSFIKQDATNSINAKTRYIGLLDSGVGGLSVLKRLYNIMPDRNYIFFGDTKNIPYGTKSPEQIFEYTKNILNFFVKKQVTHVVIACNTTSAVAYEELKQEFKGKLNIFPLIQSVAPFAIKNLENGDVIAILGTKATINSHKYKEEIQKYNPNIKVVEIDCTGFVEIVENRLYQEKSSVELIKSKLQLASDAKRIVLGCTHYPYLVNIFKSILNVEYFDPAETLAGVVKNEIKNDCFGNKKEFYVSKNPNEFVLSAKTFFEVNEAKLISL